MSYRKTEKTLPYKIKYRSKKANIRIKRFDGKYTKPPFYYIIASNNSVYIITPYYFRQVEKLTKPFTHKEVEELFNEYQSYLKGRK